MAMIRDEVRESTGRATLYQRERSMPMARWAYLAGILADTQRVATPCGEVVTKTPAARECDLHRGSTVVTSVGRWHVVPTGGGLRGASTGVASLRDQRGGDGCDGGPQLCPYVGRNGPTKRPEDRWWCIRMGASRRRRKVEEQEQLIVKVDDTWRILRWNCWPLLLGARSRDASGASWYRLRKWCTMRLVQALVAWCSYRQRDPPRKAIHWSVIAS